MLQSILKETILRGRYMEPMEMRPVYDGLRVITVVIELNLPTSL